VYDPTSAPDDTSTRPAKRRKVAKAQTLISGNVPVHTLKFEALLNGLESSECAALRQESFKRAWAKTDAQIQVFVVQQNLGP
jgi:origin recognition complex subunit 3